MTTQAEQQMWASQIIEGIWVGNMHVARDSDFFQKRNIQAVVNLAPDIGNMFSHQNIEYLKINVDDSLKNNDINIMTTSLPHIVEFIYTKRRLLRKNVLIHCHAGQQRSCIAMAAYLCKYHNMSIDEALAKVQKMRPIAFGMGFNVNFITSLRMYHASHVMRRNYI